MPENRRVERRSIIGNGNATDPESIQELEDEWGRRVRGNRAPPKKKFDKVVEEVSEEEAKAKEEGEKEPEAELAKEKLPKQAVQKPGARLIRI